MSALPMHLLNKQVITAGDMTGDVAGTSIEVKECRIYTVQATYTGTPTGTLKLQGSNDNTTWTDVPNSSISLSGSPGNSLLSDTPGYAYARIFYAHTSSTGTLNATFNAKR